MGRSFETLTAPNLKFPNYDSACERSLCYVGGKGGGGHCLAFTHLLLGVSQMRNE